MPVSHKEKPWGLTRQVYLDAKVELHHASIKANGYSSRHHHVNKHNLFYVLSGELAVHLYDPDLVIALHPGDKCFVRAKRDHRFVARTDVELIELYCPEHGTDIDPDDIQRVDIGGLSGFAGPTERAHHDGSST